MKKVLLLAVVLVVICSVTQSVFAATFGGGAAYYPNGFYFNAGAVMSDQSVKKMRLNTSPTPTDPLKLLKTKTSDIDLGYILSIGYAAKSFPMRVELDYTGRGDVSYDVNPLFTTVTPPPPLYETNMRSKLNSDSLMLSGILDGHFFEYVEPFVRLGIGVASNKVTGDVIVHSSDFKLNKRKTNFAWQAGIGAHIKITNNLFVNAEYRYIDLGKAIWGPWTTDWGTYSHKTSVESKKIDSNELLITLTYFFGEQKASSEAAGVPSLIND